MKSAFATMNYGNGNIVRMNLLDDQVDRASR